MMRQLACTISNEDFDDKSSTTKLQTSATTQDTTFASTSAPGIKTTKPWIWTSNTIDTGEYGQPTRHRRETEDTMSPISTKSTNDITNKISTTQASFTTTERKVRDEVTTLQTLESTSQSNSPRENEEDNTSDTISTSTVASKTSVDDTAEYPETINQGQLFSIIENGTMFDIIELNETNGNENGKKVITTTATTIRETERQQETSTAPSVMYTTVIYHKEPPETPITVTKKEPQQLNVLNNLTDKSLTKEFPIYTGLKGDSMTKLNRTFRKHVPLYVAKKINLDVDNKIQGDDHDDDKKRTESVHHTVEIKLHNVDNKNGSSSLFVTTKRILKHEIDPKIDILNRNVTINKESEDVHPTTLIDKMDNISSEEIMKQQFVTPTIQKELNLDRIKQKKKMEKEKLQIKLGKTLEAISTTVKPIDVKKIGSSSGKTVKDELDEEPLVKTTSTTEKSLEKSIEKELENFPELMRKPWENPTVVKESMTTEPAEPEPETQPRPNRQRQLTRPQRRSFYPYFFSRVLG